MATNLHILRLLAAVASVPVCQITLGHRPRLREIALAAIGGLVFSVIDVVLTTGLLAEGDNTWLPLLCWVGTTAFLACISPWRKAWWLCCLLLAATVVLGFQHLDLANSPYYTNSPSARMRIVRFNMRRGSPEARAWLASVRIKPNAHTWLTALYSVDPPTPPRVMSLDIGTTTGRR